jgi:hypothetical protein
MLICETDRMRCAESDAAGSDPNSGGKKEEIDSEENQDGSEKLFTESQVNKIVQLRLEKDRLRVDKEVENRLRELGIESAEDAAASKEWRRERDELLERTAREQELLRNELTERESRFGEQARMHEDEKREWRQKYELLLKRAELTQTALKAGADPANVDMIVTFTEGRVKVTDGGFRVVDSDGRPALDPETGTETTLEKFMRGFLSERPGLVRPASTKGAGTGALGARPGKYTLDEIREIARSDPRKYAELKSEGVVQELYEKHLAEKR